jgi:hypothetical protein
MIVCFLKPEALKSLYRSPGYKKNNWSYVKTMSCSGSHLGITINIKNTKFVKVSVHMAEGYQRRRLKCEK